MADISTFPTMHDVLVSGDNLLDKEAGEDLKAGQVVCHAATGDGKAYAADATSGERTIGVVLYNVSSGLRAAIASIGCQVKVANADASTGIDAGDYVEQNDNTVKGTVSAASEAASGSAVAISHFGLVGMAMEDIAGGGTGKVLITLGSLTQANSS